MKSPLVRFCMPVRIMAANTHTTGLDSSTTYTIIRCLRNFAHYREATLLVALLQPPPETVALFDDVMLLSEGIVVYQGPVQDVVAFFQGLGFACPPNTVRVLCIVCYRQLNQVSSAPPVIVDHMTTPHIQATADFLQEVTSYRDQAGYWARPTPHAFVPVKHLAAAFAATAQGAALLAESEALLEPTSLQRASLVYQRYDVTKKHNHKKSSAIALAGLRCPGWVRCVATCQVNSLQLLVNFCSTAACQPVARAAAPAPKQVSLQLPHRPGVLPCPGDVLFVFPHHLDARPARRPARPQRPLLHAAAHVR